MKSTQLKDAVRNIKKERVSYLSILLIAFMAVTCYVGVVSARTALLRTANGFYDETAFHDLEVVSTLLLEESDIDAIRAIDGVADAEGVYQTTAKVSDGNARLTVSVQSVTERVNVPRLTSGRLPAAANECAVEQRLLDEGMAYAVGDTIRMADGKEGTAYYLESAEYVITGIFLHPDHLCDTVQADPYVLVLPEAFSQDELEGCFMKAEVLLDKAPGTDRYDESYTASVDAVYQALETLGVERAALRDATIHGRYQDEIDENQQKLDEVAAELRDARAQLDDGAAELAENQQKLADAEKTLAETLQQLQDGSIELSDAKAVLDRTKRQLDSAAAQLAAGKATLDDTAAQLADAAQQLADGRALLDEKKAELADARQKLDDAARQLADGKAELARAQEKLEETRVQLLNAERELAEGRKKLAQSEKELAAAREELNRGEAQLADARTQIAAGEQQLAAGAAELDAAAAQIAAGEQQLAAGAAELYTTYTQIEAGKEGVRSDLRAGMETAVAALALENEEDSAKASAAVNAIVWAQPNYSPNLNDPYLRATDFQLTISPPIAVDMSGSYDAAANAVADQMIAQIESAGVELTEVQQATIRAAVISDASARSSYDAAAGQLQQWDAGHAQYLSGAAQLAAAKAEYAQGLARYNVGAAELAAAKREYESGLAKYNAGLAQYEAGYAEYWEGKRQYEDGLAQYENGKAQYEAGLVEYQNGVAQYDEKLAEYQNGEAQYADGLAQYNDGVAQYEESLTQYNDGKAQYDEGVTQYESSLAEYESARRRYNKGVSDYQSAKKQYEDGVTAYEEGVAQYEDGMQQLAEGRETLAEKEKEYADGVAQYEDGVGQLDEARDRLDALDPARWIVLDTNANGGYVQMRTSSTSVGNIGNRFTTLFLVIAALVIYATVGKIVDEQHKLVGATKAFGFYNREILAKYLIYGVSATAVGVLVGSLASLLLQIYVAAGFSKVFITGQPVLVVRLGTMVIVLVLACLLAAAAVWIASSNLMRSTAIRLMQDSAPAGSKKSTSGKSVLSLYQRLILRNMRTDIQRIFITVVSVTGCCALIVIGFTMRAGFSETPDRQYGQIVRYDFDLAFEPDENGDTQRAMEEVLASVGADAVPAYRTATSVKFGSKTSFGELAVMDAPAIERLFSLTDVQRKQPVSVGSDGIYIISGFRDTHGVGSGDPVTLTVGAGTTATATIAAAYKNYAGQFLFLTPEYYEKLFGETPDANYLMGNLNGADFDALADSLRAVEGFDKLQRSDTMRALFDSFSLIILALVALLTFAAGLMAAVILTNLTNIYIRQKTRELAVMRVNGFSVRETISYVLRETYVTTGLGILLGCAAGSALAIWIIGSFESPYFRFVAEPNLVACLIASAITVLFTVIINIFALRKVKNLKLTDAAQ